MAAFFKSQAPSIRQAVAITLACQIALVIVMVIIANLTLWLISALRRRLAPWYDDRKIAGAS